VSQTEITAPQKLRRFSGKAAIGREAVYIAQHDAVLWLGEKLHAFDCKTNRMAELDVALPEGSYGHECAMVYDPKHAGLTRIAANNDNPTVYVEDLRGVL
jgi:hypothetical protein